ncbi:PAS domain-containing protein [Bradyrhizobium sp. WSM 1704]|uniref:PAS domain-containing protein n=1 Tax=Bradyrhizobium semiaridum TaxID=2821404 RepID=UPI001CE3A6EA|nr:PAS domain-containing protein [Bradyrhizobium semiaridum]MCA6122913.1 PAS domain-containing protein [Bradyrhizobium semiaridum]
MKHESSREFFAYWNAKRGSARAPDRSEFDPSAVRDLLADTFVLSYDGEAGYPFRVAGTRISALLGCDLKNCSFSTLFSGESRGEIEDIVTCVAEETLPAIAGVTATTEKGAKAHFELLLLPFTARVHEPVSLTGLLVPFEDNTTCVRDLALTSWRYLHPPERFVPRALRKLAIARGFVVYEGLR